MIRKLTKSDQPALEKWASHFSPRPEFNWDAQTLVSTLEDAEIWGKFDDTELIAALAYQTQPDYFEILWLATRPGYEKQGHMRKLLQNRLDDASSQWRRVLLEVHEKNQKALSLYAQLGFVRVGARKNYYSDGASALLLTFSASKTKA